MVLVERVLAVTMLEVLAALTVAALLAATEVMVALRNPVLETEGAEAVLRVFPVPPELTVC
jgi:hypothetical protein